MHFSTVLNVVLQFKQISKLHFQTEAFVRFRNILFTQMDAHLKRNSLHFPPMNGVRCLYRLSFSPHPNAHCKIVLFAFLKI